MKNKILVTGSSGYIGQHLCKMLQNTEYEIHGLDMVENTNYLRKFHQVDIRKPFKLLDEYHTVIHLAALVNVGDSVLYPEEYYNTNLYGTINTLKSVSYSNFVLASTGAAVECKSPYGVSKRAAEDVVKSHCKDKQYTRFRFYNVIGSDGIDPTNKDGLFYNLVNAASVGSFTIFGTDYNTPDGSCIRDYVHVNEICDALIQSITRSSPDIENLGHGIGHSVLELASKFKEVNSVDFQILYGDRREGDVECSVLSSVSTYMNHTYTFTELLRYG